jgi:hypothetical protein
MNYFDLYSSYPDRTIASAWDSQVKEADKTPWLADTLTECGDELFARFAACYAELRALPRSTRRALQRQLARSSELAAILPEYLQQGGRRLQHRMAWSLAGAALLLALGQGVATAATITVTTNDPRIIPDGQCSLVEAIVNANDDAATHSDCPPGSGADTIVLPANAYMMLSNAYVPRYTTPFGTFSGIPAGLPVITSQITIEGNGATIHRHKNAPAFGLVRVRGNTFFPVSSPPGDLTVQGVTLSGGSSFGGLLNDGTLRIKNSTISGNTERGVNNNYRGALTIENSTISGNTGGGVSNGGTASIANSTISGNTSNYSGGGVSNSYGIVTIENSTISNNAATNDGGGISNAGGATRGRGLTITNSTISGNRANRGGGISNNSQCFDYYYSPSTCPTALTVNNSLIAGNQAAIAPELENAGSNSIVNANNFNLFGTNGNAGVSGFTPGPTDMVPGVSVAQILGPLKNNGGPTQTHALVAGSPAIDAGDPGGCRNSQGALLGSDQRDFARNFDGNNDGTARCDIGAVEFGAGSATPVDFDGDGVTDIGVYRNGTWFVLRSSDGGVRATEWGGLPQDKPVPGDFDGDGKVDHTVYRDGTWFVIRSSDGGVRATDWGGLPQDVPLPADYDGDGKTDIAVYRDGIWFIIRSSDGAQISVGWGGLPQDVPVPADYDGDGKVDIAVYRDGTWFILRSSDGEVRATGWGGVLADVPVPADYDGDGKADIAVYRDGIWFIIRSSDGAQVSLGWGGLPQDIPVPADYDGDGKADIAVYRDGIWFIIRSSDGMQTSVGWGGAAEDIPLNRAAIIKTSLQK